MAKHFLTGAVASRDVLSTVIGQPVISQTVPASLGGHRLVITNLARHVALVADAGVADPSQRVAGVLVDLDTLDALDKGAQARLAFYHACFECDPHPVEVTLEDGTTTTAITYIASAEAGDSTATQAYLADWTPLYARMSYELMAYIGRKSPQDLRVSLSPMLTRAAAWVEAQKQPQQRDLSKDVIVHAHRHEYVNYFSGEEMDLQFRRYDGSMSEVHNRGVWAAGHAAVVLPYDPQRDTVLLVEQFRAATYMVGEQCPWMWEAPAGMIDPGESPEDAARREAKEETGVNLQGLDFAGRLYSSSGSLGELVYCYIGVADLSEVQGGGGIQGEGEDVRSKVMSFHELMSEVDNHTFSDLPLVTTALWLARHRDRLRANMS